METAYLMFQKKIKRCIVGILCKTRHNATLNFKQFYFTLIYPFLTYAVLSWRNTYPSSLKSLVVLQIEAVRMFTFSKFDKHTSPMFYSSHLACLNYLTLSD